MTAGGKSVLFGDFSKFIIRAVNPPGLLIFRERFMVKMQLGYLGYKRFDSALMDPNTGPIRYLQHPTS